MRAQYKVLVILLSFLILGGLSCASEETTRVDDVTIATGIAFDNSAENSITEIAATTRTIYLSARVVDPTTRTKVHSLPAKILKAKVKVSILKKMIPRVGWLHRLKKRI